MNIKGIKEVEASAKGLIVVGKIAKIFDGKRIQGTKNGKDYDFVATSIKLEDDTGSIYTQFTDVDDDFLALEGKTISCISCSINEYVDKQGVTQRSLRAGSYSAEVIPETSQPELPEVQIEDPTHQESQKIRVVKEEETQEELETPVTIEKGGKPSVWDNKDLRIVRQNSNLHATTLVCKFFKGTLEDSVTVVKNISNDLVDSVYQGLKFPINNKQADIPHNEKQADLLKDIKAGSDENVKDYELDSLDKKALEYKKQLNELTGDDIEYGTILGKFDISQPYELKDKEQKAELVTQLANAVIELKKGE